MSLQKRVYEVDKGETIGHAAANACELARHWTADVCFIFNGVALQATPKSYYGDIAEIYSLKMQILRLQGNNRD